MKNLSFSNFSAISKKVLSVICALCVFVSVIAIPLAVMAENTEKMFVISPNASGGTKCANVFMPLDFMKTGSMTLDSNKKEKEDKDGNGYYYFKLTFKAKLLGENESLPIVSIVRYAYWVEGGASQPEHKHTNNNQMAHEDSILSSSYNPDTLEFTAIVKIWIAERNCNPKTGAHTAIAIGNMEHNGGSYKESNFDAHFAFTGPELYLYDTATKDIYGENLIKGIYDNTVNSGKTYTHPKDEYTGSDQIMAAPANMWSYDTTASMISLQDIPKDYFSNKHKYILNPMIIPTKEKDGIVEHYTCECEDCVGKYYKDKNGRVELSEEEIIIPKDPEDRMLLINTGGEERISNIFVPLDLNDSGVMDPSKKNVGVYVKVSFKAKMFSGTQPIVGRLNGYKLGNTQGSMSAHNSAYNNQISTTTKGVYSEYNPDTMMFTAVIRLYYGSSTQTLANGIHEVITIGNAEHNAGGVSEKDYNASFVLYQPECYVLDANGEPIGNNIFPALNEYSFDSKKIYKHKQNPYTASDSLIFAPKDRWSVDTSVDGMEIYSVMQDYFTPGVHNFVEHPAKEATLTEAGNKIYYTCDCDHCDGKYFSQYGLAEVSKEDITITKKMIVVSPNSSGGTKTANAFIPLNFRESGGVKFNDNNYYFKLTFKLKILGNSMPIIGMMRYNPYDNHGSCSEFKNANNNQLDHDDEVIYSEYDPETMTFTAVVKTWIDDKYSSSPTGAHTAITIGNMEHNNNWRSEYNFDANFAFSDPKLYAYDASTDSTYGENLIADITDATFYDDKVYQHLKNDYAGEDNIMAAPANKWCIDGQKSMVTLSDIPKDYFLPTEGTSHMVIFAGRNDDNGNGKQGSLYQRVKLEAGKNYQLSYNAKYAGTGIEGDKLGGQLEYYSGKTLKELTAVKTESQTDYKEIYRFTMPSDADSGSNFRFTFNYSSAFTSGYMANFELYEVDAAGNPTGKNLFKNGDFSVGGISMWKKQGECYQFIISEIPENFFSKTNPINPGMVIYRNTSDYAQIMQMPMLKPNTTYEYSHTALHTDYASDKKPYSIVYEFYINKNGKGANASIPDERIEKTIDGAKTTMKFTTLENLRVKGDNNSIFRLYMRANSAGYYGLTELYELDKDGNRIGNNLLLNADFTCDTLAWQKDGDMTIRIVETPDNFFETYSKPTEMVYSNGQLAEQSYSQTVKVAADKTHYYSGFFVNMNSVGVNPQVQYLAKDGSYKVLSEKVSYESDRNFYDADRYFFEITIDLPEDASINNGQAEIRVEMNNFDKGKGYFAGLMLCEEGKYMNLLNDSAYSTSANFEKMKYSSDVFVFYYDDEKFDDGDWSGERAKNIFDIKYGTLSGRVVDKNGMAVSGIKIKLMPGDITVTTDATGRYLFDNLKPSSYKLYLVENEESSLFCLDINIQKGIGTILPSLIYDKDGNSAELDNSLAGYGMLKGYYYDKKGKIIKGAKLYLRDNGEFVTDENGMFTFEKIKPGKYDLYTVLDDGKEYVLRTVEIAANKGIQIKVMEPIIKEAENNTWIIIAIIAVSVLVLGDGALATILIIKKKKAIKI